MIINGIRRVFGVLAVVATPTVLFPQFLEPLPGRTTPAATPNKTMTIEIWSDVVCPFCYIGKREFEAALARFEHKAEVTVVWKSFELDPNAPQRSEHDMYGMLSNRYGISRAEAQARVQGVVERAKTVGLDYHMDKAIISSSFDAHRLIQFAKTKGKGAEAEERLFKAYFVDGIHIADHAALTRMGVEIGLEEAEVSTMLASTRFTEEVRADEREAQQLGVRGVPFFVIDRRYGVSGAQHSDHFLGALQQAWKERSAVE
ncbi:MAG TPA: DsbA family oxidoreductase [Flavobacteriales bacterium]|nr:DsbA family oxidoreductase [Flavobacteriales bacterium]